METEDPMTFIVDHGLDDLLEHGKDRLLPVLPNIIIPIKSKGLIFRRTVNQGQRYCMQNTQKTEEVGALR